MMEILWTKRMSVGNRIIDSAHKELLEMVNRIASLAGEEDRFGLADEFKLLEDRLCAYFTVEENIARVIDFPFSRHKLAHHSLLNQLQRTRDDLAAMEADRPDGEGEKRCCFLRDHLIQHFKAESAQLKVVLDTHLYDLKPG